jgi:16S rRNA (uracil1498-N3)-methyltransferase
MTRRCFFVERIEPGERSVLLSDEVSYHAENVLRLKPGDPIELRDGCGGAWRGAIAKMRKGEVYVALDGPYAPGIESDLEITVALAFARSDRMELVLRQATEIGVHRFVAFGAKRSQYNLHGAQSLKRRERWTKIIREALCQCGRILLPEVVIFPDVSNLIAASQVYAGGEAEGGMKILAVENESRQDLFSLQRFSPICKRIVGVVGPEGGWERSEVDQFLEAGFRAVHLGPRTLRLETAAIALLASIQLLWGDFGREGKDLKYEMPEM